jgi:lipoyl(octanoyl) transferase
LNSKITASKAGAPGQGLCSTTVCVVDSSRTGQRNMEIDAGLLQNAEEAPGAATYLRFYQWDVPTVSLGKHQRPSQAVDLDYCREKAIPVVHRPSGGRAVFHADEVTYALVSNDPALFPLGDIQATYLSIARALQEGFALLGVVCDLSGGAEPSPEIQKRFALPSPKSASFKLPCFISSSRFELLFQGRKIAGSAQRRLKRSFLQHGSVPLRIDYERMAAVLNVAEGLIRSTTIAVSEAAAREVLFEEACACLKNGFERTFGRPFAASPLDPLL